MTLALAAPIVHRPLAYDVGPLQVTGFGLAVLLAFVIGQIIPQRELARRGHDPEPIADLMLAAVLGTLVGAKVYYAVLNMSLDDLFSRAGFVYWGGLIGGALAVTAVAVRRKLGVMRIADVVGLAMPAGYAIGRTGCWAVGDDYGRPWDGPLAVAFPEGAPPSRAGVMAQYFGTPVPPGTPPDTVLAVHPTQLYEVAMGIAMFLIIWRLRDHRHAEGWLFGLYLALAGVERFAVEFFRAKDDRFFGVITVAQVISVAFIVVGLIWMQRRWRVGPGARGIYAA